jgi:hypothetical protein
MKSSNISFEHQLRFYFKVRRHQIKYIESEVQNAVKNLSNMVSSHIQYEWKLRRDICFCVPPKEFIYSNGMS